MDAIPQAALEPPTIVCIEMHTTGEPTRIVVDGYPDLQGTLLEQRAQAKAQHDHYRRRIMLEPRGHFNMYGAILRADTELTRNGTAHMGVLFTHNDGYSTMCGHATIALGRFLLDTHDLKVFPRRNGIAHDAATKTAVVNLHAPCGLLRVTVPTADDGRSSDPKRPVTFVSVPSFATGLDIRISVPSTFAWPELGQRESLRVSFGYGGAFYGFVSPAELGFREDMLRSKTDLDALSRATRQLKAAITAKLQYRMYFEHPQQDDLSFLYGIVVVDRRLGRAMPHSIGAETGLCFFADQEVDRSPTGSAVAARVALAYARGDLSNGQSWTYHSLLSNTMNASGAFVGTVVAENPIPSNGQSMATVSVKVEGYAFYTGHHTFVVEAADPLRDDGFVFDHLNA